MSNTTKGIDGPNVTAWFGANVAGVQPPLTFDLIAGGHSNLTYRVTDTSGGTWVLRRPPLHQVLATAHDVEREHRIISALAATPVPVPTTPGLCLDESVNDRPFYVMDFVDGLIVRNAKVAADLAIDVRRQASDSLVDVLAAIHAVDPNEVGLGELGRKEDYVGRQLRRWLRQFEASKTDERPAVEQIHDRLAAAIPEQGPATIVHGDYRLDNCIVNPAGEVIAVLDWELCTLGDPLVDVAQLLIYWAEPDDEVQPLDSPPSTVTGFASRDELVARYGAASGRDVGDMSFYLSFASWRLACILEGVYSRYVSGAMGDVLPSDLDAFVARIEALLDLAAEHADGI